MEPVIKSLPAKKSLGFNGFSAEFYQIFKEVTPMLFKLFQKIQRKGMFSNLSYKASIVLIPKLGKNAKNKVIDQSPLMNIDAKIIDKILAN
jgi:hypothetical protein